MSETTKKRGLQTRDIIATSERVRSHRTKWQKFEDKIEDKGSKFFNAPLNGIMFTALAFPILSIPLLPIAGGIMLFAMAKGKRILTPFQTLPLVAGEYDESKDKFTYLDGIETNAVIFMATDDETGGEFWINKDYATRHTFMFGTTGAGKTEAILSICFSYMSFSSGYMFIDAKGTYELYAKAYNTARVFGREDDVLLLSYLTGNQDVRAAYTTIKVSNTQNIVSRGSHDSLLQTIGAMIPQSGGDNKIWSDMAMTLLEVILGILVYRRDVLKQAISLVSIQHYMNFKNLFETFVNARNVRDDPTSLHYLPDWVYDALYNFLTGSLSGFREDKSFEEQAPEVFKYFGFASMQFAKVLGSFTGLYGYIFNVEQSEIDFRDVVLNNRIVIGLLPSLGKAPSELKNMGVQLVTLCKQMFATLTGDEVEGAIEDILEYSPAKGKYPNLLILDEWAQIAPEKGAAVLQQQVRSLNAALLVAAQDYRSCGEEARAIIGSSNLLIGMKLQDVETFELFSNKQREADARVTTGSHIENNRMIDNNTQQFERRQVLVYSDFESQGQGEAHFLMNGSFIRGKFPYIAIPMPSKAVIKVNQFLAIPKPDKQTIDDLNKAYETAEANIIYANTGQHKPIENPNINKLKTNFIGLLREKISQTDDFCQNSEFAIFGTLAHICNEKAAAQKELRERQNKRMISQVQYLKPEQFLTAALERYNEDMADLHKKMRVAPPLGLSEERFIHDALPFQATVQGNVQQARDNVVDSQRFINTGLYPTNNLPERTPIQMRKILRTIHTNIRNETQAQMDVRNATRNPSALTRR